MGEHAIFITQSALREISRHVWSEPDQELLGFLLGERRESPETRTRYLLVTATTRSSYVIPEASVEVLSEEAWHASHLEARRRHLQLVGWYHSAPYVGPGPALRDTQSHEAHFPEPWQVGMILAPRAERASGGFFRTGSREEAERFLPFYEVVDDAGLLPDGQKRSVLAWANYVPDAPPAPATQVAVALPRMGAGTIPIVIPAARAEDAARGPLSRRRVARR
jgi:proteasome lid subunit RPN8/RPN11